MPWPVRCCCCGCAGCGRATLRACARYGRTEGHGGRAAGGVQPGARQCPHGPGAVQGRAEPHLQVRTEAWLPPRDGQEVCLLLRSGHGPGAVQGCWCCAGLLVLCRAVVLCRAAGAVQGRRCCAGPQVLCRAAGAVPGSGVVGLVLCRAAGAVQGRWCCAGPLVHHICRIWARAWCGSGMRALLLLCKEAHGSGAAQGSSQF